jgi:uncharacterized protein (TIGR03083 family)
MSDSLDVLEQSVAHLRAAIAALNESQYVASAHPTEWTVADVMSHIGSAAIIFKRGVDDSVNGRETPPQFNQSVWDVWNAKTPHAQVTDSLDADKALITRLRELTPEERDSYKLNLGPMVFDFDHAVRLRLGEHVLHTWDIEEAFDTDATLQPDAVPFLFANLELLTRFAAKPSGNVHTLHIRTIDPQKDFALTQTTDGVTLEEVEGVKDFDLEIPAEAFLRLAYGRLDADHTPAGIDPEHLDELRRVFPGF